MKIVRLFLVIVIVLTPTTALAQSEKQLIHKPTSTTELDLESKKLLQLEINQQIQKFNGNIGHILAQTRELKRFSAPIEAEFHLRNEQIQRNRDFQALPRF
ncbi:MAG: hypothetical protein PUP93_31415 [Rhizonema sp. NSF051]|nr:hypothetical protein [Rhizonema sp. NSF051]